MNRQLNKANKNTLERIKFDYDRHLPMTIRERLLMAEILKLEDAIGIGRKKTDEKEEELSED